MSSNIFGVLNTAKVGLLSQQLAIEVTGHNIANVQTEGFSRQAVVLDANTPRITAQGQLGTGVRVLGIQRVHDQFLLGQLVTEGSPLGNFRVREDVYDQLEILFNESQGRSLNNEMSSFFASLQDLATNPGALPERADMIAKAQSLVSVFNHLGNELFQFQRNVDNIIAEEIPQINVMLQEIAKLNKGVFENEPGDFLANDLRDKRDMLIKEVSEKLDINMVRESDGQVSLTLRNGLPLVLRETVFALSTQSNGDNLGFRDVMLDNGSGVLTNVTSQIQGGEIRGYLDMRDVEMANILDKINRLAAGFTQEFNRVHQQGFGLDGSTGVNFFKPLDPTVFTNTANTGSATVAMTNGSPTSTSIDQYEMTFTGSNTFLLTNLTTGATSGTFSFTSGSTFNVAGGIAVTISSGAAAGDRFRFSISNSAAAKMAVSSEVIADSRKIAAGLGRTGDGNNALALADLQESLVFDSTSLVPGGSGAFTFDEFYNAVVSTVGLQSFTAQAGTAQQEGVLLQLRNRRDSISGVSIDEEMINLIKFQEAYNASARIINVVQEMFDTLIDRI
jgi:flagellar hook-associated protein 1 FlgK